MALLAAFLIPALLSPVVLAQTDAAPTSVQAAMDRLREAPDYERPGRAEDVVEFGDEAIPLLLAEVRDISDAADANLVMNCVIALGELKAEQATDSLIAALNSTRMDVAYLAAKALDAIWDGKGVTDPAAVRSVNAALLAVLYSDCPPELAYGPGVALVNINKIGIQRPENLPADQLIGQIETWANAHAEALPDADQQPWQINLRTAMTSRDAATRSAALDALRRKRALQMIEPALEGLVAGLSSDVRSDLVRLIGELAGVPYPPSGVTSGDPQEEVDAWRAAWLAKLSQQTEQRYLDAAWHELERAHQRYLRDPNEGTAVGVELYRDVVLCQLASPDQIPAGASPKAKALLEPALKSKSIMSRAVQVLEGTPQDYEKATQLSAIADEARKEQVKAVAQQFLGRLAALARKEMNDTIAAQMGSVLGLISGIPCDLDTTQPADRAGRIDEWLTVVRMVGLPVGTS